MPFFWIAQSLLEYGVLDALASKLTSVTYSIQDWFRRQDHPQLILVLGILVLLLVVRRSFRPHG